MDVEGKESVTEKLLEASGVPQSMTPQQSLELRLQQMESLHKSMMSDLKNALTSAQKAQEAADKMVVALDRYCREKLPVQIRDAVDEVARQGVRESLKPLDESVRKAAGDIAGFRQSLADVPLRALHRQPANRLFLQRGRKPPHPIGRRSDR